MAYIQKFKNLLKVPLDYKSAYLGQHRQKSTYPRIWIMMYHRILPKSDPRYHFEEPGMIVEPETFSAHLNILKNEFSLLPLSEWVERKNKGLTLPQNACSITFDDGWLDNFQYAFPRLIEAQIPATLFAVSELVNTNKTFWPNRLQNLLLQPREVLMEDPWLNTLIGKSTVNKEFLTKIISRLKEKTDQEIDHLITHSEINLQVSPEESPELVNQQQLREMSNSGLIEIGSHTQNHIRLNKGHKHSTYLTEISESKKQLEAIIDKPVNLFCYPNGDLCQQAVDLVKKHYSAAVTTVNGINHSNHCDLHQLRRIGIHQDVSNNKIKLLSKLAR